MGCRPTPPFKSVAPPSLDDGRIIEHVLAPIAPQSATLDMYYPSILRSQGSTSRHHAAADEVDRELAVGLGRRNQLPRAIDMGTLIAMKKGKGDEKEDLRNLLAEMTTFAIA